MFKPFSALLLALLATLLLVPACNEAEQPEIEEDYDRLFPLKPTEKARVQPGEIIVKQGDVNVNRQLFRYEGHDTLSQKTSYNITLKYRLKEDKVDLGRSRYALRFVGENKQLVSIGSDSKTNFVPHDDYYAPGYVPLAQQPEMLPNKEYTLRFKAQSGFQLLLCVNGAGPRNSGIRARLTAVAEDDGLTEPIVLQTDQYQTQEGQAMLPQPYCKYVVLP
ncbi:MAG: hypothetical protein Q4D66_06405 [Bacteroidales bacterium]|nr:hypothetical protein [Bacteroidales bacterium]